MQWSEVRAAHTHSTHAHTQTHAHTCTHTTFLVLTRRWATSSSPSSRTRQLVKTVAKSCPARGHLLFEAVHFGHIYVSLDHAFLCILKLTPYAKTFDGGKIYIKCFLFLHAWVGLYLAVLRISFFSCVVAAGLKASGRWLLPAQAQYWLWHCCCPTLVNNQKSTACHRE